MQFLLILVPSPLRGGLMFVGLSVFAVSRSVATSRSDLCTLGGGVSGEQMFSCMLGHQGMDLGLRLCLFKKFREYLH